VAFVEAMATAAGAVVSFSPGVPPLRAGGAAAVGLWEKYKQSDHNEGRGTQTERTPSSWCCLGGVGRADGWVDCQTG